MPNLLTVITFVLAKLRNSDLATRDGDCRNVMFILLTAYGRIAIETQIQNDTNDNNNNLGQKMICFLFRLQTFFQIKDEDAMKKYVYFGGIEHSIRKEVILITQEDIKITKVPLELSEITFSQDLSQRTTQCQAVQCYLRSVHVDVRL